jgi:hypothetical protein
VIQQSNFILAFLHRLATKRSNKVVGQDDKGSTKVTNEDSSWTTGTITDVRLERVGRIRPNGTFRQVWVAEITKEPNLVRGKAETVWQRVYFYIFFIISCIALALALATLLLLYSIITAPVDTNISDIDNMSSDKETILSVGALLRRGVFFNKRRLSLLQTIKSSFGRFSAKPLRFKKFNAISILTYIIYDIFMSLACALATTSFAYIIYALILGLGEYLAQDNIAALGLLFIHFPFEELSEMLKGTPAASISLVKDVLTYVVDSSVGTATAHNIMSVPQHVSNGINTFCNTLFFTFTFKFIIGIIHDWNVFISTISSVAVDTTSVSGILMGGLKYLSYLIASYFLYGIQPTLEVTVHILNSFLKSVKLLFLVISPLDWTTDELILHLKYEISQILIAITTSKFVMEIYGPLKTMYYGYIKIYRVYFFDWKVEYVQYELLRVFVNLKDGGKQLILRLHGRNQIYDYLVEKFKLCDSSTRADASSFSATEGPSKLEHYFDDREIENSTDENSIKGKSVSAAYRPPQRGDKGFDTVSESGSITPTASSSSTANVIDGRLSGKAERKRQW